MLCQSIGRDKWCARTTMRGPILVAPPPLESRAFVPSAGPQRPDESFFWQSAQLREICKLVTCNKSRQKMVLVCGGSPLKRAPVTRAYYPDCRLQHFFLLPWIKVGRTVMPSQCGGNVSARNTQPTTATHTVPQAAQRPQSAVILQRIEQHRQRVLDLTLQVV